jgi:hypothetical protein
MLRCAQHDPCLWWHFLYYLLGWRADCRHLLKCRCNGFGRTGPARPPAVQKPGEVARVARAAGHGPGQPEPGAPTSESLPARRISRRLRAAPVNWSAYSSSGVKATASQARTAVPGAGMLAARRISPPAAPPSSSRRWPAHALAGGPAAGAGAAELCLNTAGRPDTASCPPDHADRPGGRVEGVVLVAVVVEHDRSLSRSRLVAMTR